jgi:hypothetical protein
MKPNQATEHSSKHFSYKAKGTIKPKVPQWYRNPQGYKLTTMNQVNDYNGY